MSMKLVSGNVYTWDAAKGWGQMPDPLLPFLEKTKDDVEKAFEKAGFQTIHLIGSADGSGHFHVYSHRSTTSKEKPVDFQFLISLTFNYSTIQDIYFESMIDLIEFLSKYAGLVFLSVFMEKSICEAVSLWAEKMDKEWQSTFHRGH